MGIRVLFFLKNPQKSKGKLPQEDHKYAIVLFIVTQNWTSIHLVNLKVSSLAIDLIQNRTKMILDS
jgi:hypothetical protein